MLMDTRIKCDVSGVDGIVSAFAQFNQYVKDFLKAHETELMLDKEDARRALALIYLKDIQKERSQRSVVEMWDIVMNDLNQFAVAEISDLTRFFEREEKDTWDVCSECQEARPIGSMVYSARRGYTCQQCIEAI